MNHRVIARLDIKGPDLVKGIHLEGLRVLGKPDVFAKYYYENGIDELIYQDCVASLFERNSLQDIISQTASNIFIPLTVGGGLRSVSDIREVLRAGADKVSINTAAIKNPNLIKESALEFGSSTIVVAIEAIKDTDGKYYCYIDNGREETGKEVLSWAKEVESLGAGEILLTSVDKEGTGEGFDDDLIKLVAKEVKIPVIAHGGAGSSEDVAKGIETGADAVAIASILHYDAVTKIAKDGHESVEGNTEFLKRSVAYGKITPNSIGKIKSHLHDVNIGCRVLDL